MANITKKVDTRIEPGKRYQYWASSENNDDGDPIAAGDIFKIEDSLGRPANTLSIQVSEDIAEFSIRINSQVVTYKRSGNTKYEFGLWETALPNLDEPVIQTDTTKEPIVITDNFELRTLAVSDVQIVSFYAGSFTLFVS